MIRDKEYGLVSCKQELEMLRRIDNELKVKKKANNRSISEKDDRHE